MPGLSICGSTRAAWRGTHLGAEVALGCRKAEGPPGICAHQGLAQAAHHLRIDLVLVARSRVGGVDDVGVVGADDLLAEHGHAEVLMGDARLAAAEERALVPLGRPHLRAATPQATSHHGALETAQGASLVPGDQAAAQQHGTAERTGAIS